MIDIVFLSKNHIVLMSEIVFFISLSILGLSKLPSRESIIALRKYVTRINIYIYMYILCNILFNIFMSILIVMIIIYLNSFPEPLVSANMISFYISLFFSLVSLIVCIIVYIRDRLQLKRNSNIEFIISNLPFLLYKLIYPIFKVEYYIDIDHKDGYIVNKRRKKMNLLMDRATIEKAKGEVLNHYIKDYLILAIVFFFIFVIFIVYRVLSSKRISILNFVYAIPVIVFLFPVVRSSILINATFNKYIDADKLSMSITINDNSLKIVNNFDNSNSLIDIQDIKRIVYLEHVTIIVEKNNLCHIIPSCGNLDYLIINKK